MYELQRRLAENGVDTIAVAAHPGTSRAELTRHRSGPMQAMSWTVEHVIGHDARMGALPTLRSRRRPRLWG